MVFLPGRCVQAPVPRPLGRPNPENLERRLSGSRRELARCGPNPDSGSGRLARANAKHPGEPDLRRSSLLHQVGPPRVIGSGSVQREILEGGALRLSADDAAFVIRRVRPGLLWIFAAGRDRGQFETAVTDELTAEFERFPLETSLFIHALQIESVALPSRDLWTTWLHAHRVRLRHLHMLVRTPAMQLVADVAGHYARVALSTYSDSAEFLLALRNATVDGRSEDPATHTGVEDFPAATIARRTSPNGVTLDDGRCRYELRTLARDVVLMAIEGADHGTLASLVFDELHALRSGVRRLRLFVDLRAATIPSPRVARLWSTWFQAHRPTLERVVILSTHNPVSVTAGIVGWRSQTGDLIRQMSDASIFDDMLRPWGTDRAAPP